MSPTQAHVHVSITGSLPYNPWCLGSNNAMYLCSCPLNDTYLRAQTPGLVSSNYFGPHSYAVNAVNHRPHTGNVKARGV